MTKFRGKKKPTSVETKRKSARGVSSFFNFRKSSSKGDFSVYRHSSTSFRHATRQGNKNFFVRLLLLASRPFYLYVQTLRNCQSVNRFRHVELFRSLSGPCFLFVADVHSFSETIKKPIALKTLRPKLVSAD